jgi:ribosomal protein L7/L12
MEKPDMKKPDMKKPEETTKSSKEEKIQELEDVSPAIQRKLSLSYQLAYMISTANDITVAARELSVNLVIELAELARKKFVVEGMTYELSLDQIMDIRSSLALEKKIEAIKKFRVATSCGLKEAKEAIENHFDEIVKAGT